MSDTPVMGRPTEYTEKLADEICDEIENSIFGLDHLCLKNPHWPTVRNIRKWLRKYEYFRQKYVEVKDKQADNCAEETLVVAYDDKKDFKVIIDDEGNEKTIFVAEAVARSNLKVKTLQWTAARLAPRKWGDQKDNGTDQNKESLLQKLIDKL